MQELRRSIAKAEREFGIQAKRLSRITDRISTKRKPKQEEGNMTTKLETALRGLNKTLAKLVGNERGDDDDARQMVADLISSDDSPFTPDDEDSLRLMSGDTLKAMVTKFLGAKANADEDEVDGETQEALLGLNDRQKEVAKNVMAFHRDNDARRARADLFCARDRLFKNVGRAVAKSNKKIDPAVEAMTAYSSGITTR